ncbi:hypothetical protein [Novosphingobium meiothermophilum]|uniref:hypothetical protein n=1 Tax=Novosphingobium meiothermophilum TaxID=2202251 RepID=UPI0011AB7C57|nr:hypothetical protein [Novosphingobium meiothermophilum]
MATITSLADDRLPSVNTDVSSIVKTLAFTNGVAASGDQVNVLTFPPNFRERLVDAIVRTSATLGAGCTLQLRLNRGGSFTVLTAATTAGAASKVDASAQAGVPITLQGGDIIELLVGGANVAAAATVTVDLLLAGATG